MTRPQRHIHGEGEGRLTSAPLSEAQVRMVCRVGSDGYGLSSTVST